MKHFVITLLILVTQASAQEFTIKFATLAPEGSAWITVMKEYDQAIRKESGGRLGFKIYAGGVAGDEKDVERIPAETVHLGAGDGEEVLSHGGGAVSWHGFEVPTL